MTTSDWAGIGRNYRSAFTGKARQLIGELPDGPAQRALVALTDLITGRDH